jgi:hypothetical protein
VCTRNYLNVFGRQIRNNNNIIIIIIIIMPLQLMTREKHVPDRRRRDIIA